MNEIKPNSHKYKEEQKANEKKIEKVVSGKVRTKKKNGIHKLTDVFISEDAANVKSYIFMDVLVPAIKKATSDIIKDGIDMILYGESRSRKGGSRSYVSYASYSDRRDDRRYDSERRRSRSALDFDDIIFDTRGEAEAVLDQMIEIIERYGAVTVADMYDMVDLTAPYTANRYGWTSLRNADPVRTRDGWTIKLPRATPID